MGRYLRWWILGGLAVVILAAALYLAPAAHTDVANCNAALAEYVLCLTP